jgi:hypothetical protein
MHVHYVRVIHVNPFSYINFESLLQVISYFNEKWKRKEVGSEFLLIIFVNGGTLLVVQVG